MTKEYRSLTIRYLVGATGLAAGWILFALYGTPWIIESAYDRRSLPVLNDLITGQNNHPVTFYLDAWLRVRSKATIAVLGALVAMVASAPLHGPVLRAARDWLRRAPTVGLITLACLGGCLGWLGGMLEYVWGLVRFSDLPYGPSVETVWLAPTAGAATGIALALVLGLIAGKAPLSLKAVTAMFASLIVYSVLRNSALGLQPAAAGILAVGVGFQPAVLAARRPKFVAKLVRRLLPVLLAISLVSAVAVAGAEYAAERQALTALPPAPSGAPNVLLLLIDTQRASRMSLYGHDRPTTPNIDRLAARSVVFDMGLATSSWTLPSHASMLSGLWASEFDANFRVPIEEGPEMLAEVLTEVGYSTAGFVGNYGYLARRSGVSRGFARYEDETADLREWLDANWLSKSIFEVGQKLLGAHGLTRKSAQTVNEGFLAWQERQSRPYFAFLNYFDVHDLYESPAPFNTLYRDPAPRGWVPSWGFSEAYSDGDVQEMLDAYDSAITYLDSQLGDLLEELEVRGALDNTILILTGDHGEHFGEREMALHGNSLYLPVTRVPLLISFPGEVPGGVRVGQPASIRDIPATVLELTGMLPGRLPGRSLARHWTRPDSAEGADDLIYMNLKERAWFMPQDIVRHGTMNGVVQGTLHYIVDGRGAEELFDVEQDPDQLENLIERPEYEARIERLRAALAVAPGGG